jgi:hypothetical protein
LGDGFPVIAVKNYDEMKDFIKNVTTNELKRIGEDV